MSKFFISLGKFNKKLLLPLICIALNICINCYEMLYISVYIYDNDKAEWKIDSSDYYNSNMFIYNIGSSLGLIMTIFVNIFCKYTKRYEKNKTKKKKKNICIHIIILIIFIGLSNGLIYIFFPSFEKSEIFNFTFCLEIVGLTVISHFLLKYRYYIHHIISIIIITIFGILNDAISGKFSDKNKVAIFSSCFLFSIDSITYIYFKYLIEFKYYYFMDVLLIFAISNFILIIATYSIKFGIKKINGVVDLIFFELYKRYIESDFANMTIQFLFGLIFDGFLKYIIIFLILDKLTSNHAVISLVLGNILVYIYFIAKSHLFPILLIFVFFQFLGILFYMEILEFNFCSLNKNTERNILERERLQAFEDNIHDEEITIQGYDISELVKKQERKTNKEDEEIQEKN